MVDIFIPTLGRAEKLQRVVDNIQENTPEGEYKIYFIIEPGDGLSADAIFATAIAEMIINEHEACYAGAINTAYGQTTNEYFFTGADDLDFHKGWLEIALSHMKDGILVVGTNDLGSIPISEARDATHYLIARKYIEEQSGRIDAPNTVLYPYDHNYTDKEFIETAKKRKVYEYVPESEVEHLHWAWGKAQMDATYKKGFIRNQKDKQIYISRQYLWQ